MWSNYVLLLIRATKLLGFEVLRTVHRVVQSVVWRISGTSKKIKDSKRRQGYDNCVQVLNIQLFYAFDSMACTSLKNFICTHNRFENPRYVIDNSDITLITLDENYAIFGEAENKGAQLWKMEYSAFMKLAQLQYCNRLMVVPLEHFHRITKELGELRSEIVFLFNVGRCGSTLVTQVIETTGQCVSISEPGPLFGLWERQRKKVEKEEEEETELKVCKDIVRWICRPCTDYMPLIYFVKVSPSCASVLPIIGKAFPQSKYLFMYRNPEDVILSFYKVTQELPLMFVVSLMAKLSVKMRQKILNSVGMERLFDKTQGIWDDMTFGTIGFVTICQLYLEFRKKGFPISAIRYEDFLKNPNYAVRTMFEYCKLPKYLLEKSMAGLATDSQRNSPISAAKLKKHKRPHLNSNSRTYANKLLKEYGLPLLGEDCLIDGTITTRS